MTNALNLSIIEGRIVRMPELRTTANGKQMTTLTVAVNEYTKSDGQTQSRAAFISCTVWGKTAEHCCRYLVKGQTVRIKGKLRQSVWTDNSGDRHSKLQIAAGNVDFLSRPKSASQANAAHNTYTEAVPF